MHVEWCGRYHTLFRKNWSSRCSACKTTDEQHEKRHREIAELVDKINKLKAEEDRAAVEPSTPRTPLTARALNTVDGATDGATNDSAPRTTKKERKKLKKAAKAMERDKVITSADILFVANTLHPEGEREYDKKGVNGVDLAQEKDILLNLQFNNSVCNTKTARHDFIKKDHAVDLEESRAEVERLLEVFEMNTKATGKEGKLIAELATAIQSDLVHYHNELHTTAKLRDAFWRWANVRAYGELVENGKDWDDHSPRKERRDSIEQLGGADNNAAVDSEEDEESERNGSINSIVDTSSTGTAVTSPSIELFPTEKTKPKVLSIVVPPKSKEPIGDPGWKQVSKKVQGSPAACTPKAPKNGSPPLPARSLKGPYDAGGASSASTDVTIPSRVPSSAKKVKSKSLGPAIPPKNAELMDDSGWEQVGKKALKSPVVCKLKMVKNGGLHHLAQSPRGSYAALAETWNGPLGEGGKRRR